MGKSTINGPFSIANMLVYQRVTPFFITKKQLVLGKTLDFPTPLHWISPWQILVPGSMANFWIPMRKKKHEQT